MTAKPVVDTELCLGVCPCPRPFPHPMPFRMSATRAPRMGRESRTLREEWDVGGCAVSTGPRVSRRALLRVRPARRSDGARRRRRASSGRGAPTVLSWVPRTGSGTRTAGWTSASGRWWRMRTSSTSDGRQSCAGLPRGRGDQLECVPLPHPQLHLQVEGGAEQSRVLVHDQHPVVHPVPVRLVLAAGDAGASGGKRRGRARRHRDPAAGRHTAVRRSSSHRPRHPPGRPGRAREVVPRDA